MGQKVRTNPVDKTEDDMKRFMLYMFMMRLFGENIYRSTYFKSKP
jgi:hypothetical protein